MAATRLLSLALKQASYFLSYVLLKSEIVTTPRHWYALCTLQYSLFNYMLLSSPRTYKRFNYLNKTDIVDPRPDLDLSLARSADMTSISFRSLNRNSYIAPMANEVIITPDTF